MSREKIAFLGPVASYSHQAALETFSPNDFELVPQITIGDIFTAVQAGEVSKGVVPFENSTNGSVVFTLDLFADRSNSFPDIYVCAEAYLNVHHCLLGHAAAPASHSIVPENAVHDSPARSNCSTPTPSVPTPLKPRTKPVGSVNHIQRIYSHPQAFGQCEIFLGAYLKGIERVDVTSTSKAAELVAADLAGTSAAIASQIAAEVEGLDVIAQGIEDKADNTTRFFVLRKGEDVVSVRRTSHDEENVPGIPTKSLVSFAVDHRSPGALANVLDCFRESKLNLTSINSRPSRIEPFQYIFFVELEGDRIHDPEGAVKAAMRNVQEVAQSCRWLGSYENRLRR